MHTAPPQHLPAHSSSGPAFTWAGVTAVAALMLSLLGAVFQVLDWAQSKATGTPHSLSGIFAVLTLIAIVGSGWSLAQVFLRRPLPNSMIRETHTISPTRIWLIVSIVGVAFVAQSMSTMLGIRAADTATTATRGVHSHIAGACTSAALMASVVSFTLFQYWWQSFRANPAARP